MYWANFFHIYQPPNWSKEIIKKVAKESYRPLLKILKKNPTFKITLNLSGSLTEQLADQGYTDIINDIKKLAGRQQIEMVESAMYHPILPLLPEAEIIRQINLNHHQNKKYFGKNYHPTGFFPPEMAFSEKMGKIVEKMGYKWIIADEIVAYGQLGKIYFDSVYKIKGQRIKLVFRNRYLSDYISFHSQIKKPEDFWKQIAIDGRSKFSVITAMDGENLGHHRKKLDLYWKFLLKSNYKKIVTVSELLKKYKKTEIITPHPASWSSQEDELKRGVPYALWEDKNNPIHFYQWKLLNEVIKLVNDNRRHEEYPLARAMLDQALASDQFWWASAKPWWSLDIIREKIAEIARIPSILQTKPGSIEKTALKVVNLAEQWQKTGRYNKISEQYLKRFDTVRYIGGKKVASH
ncbi:MAG: hypothetical protein WCV50_06390 [Patescibacteria group bacterium]|jgi:alpha-amylase/alpha-mannosidase (GH57 family)